MIDSVAGDLKTDPTVVLLEKRLVAQEVAKMVSWALGSVGGDLQGVDKDNQGWWCLQVPNTQQFHTHLLWHLKTGHKKLKVHHPSPPPLLLGALPH